MEALGTSLLSLFPSKLAPSLCCMSIVQLCLYSAFSKCDDI